jgi:uncharacterized protein YaeQ
MSHKHAFTLASTEPKRGLPSKIILGQHGTETRAHVLLKLLSYLLFFREHLQIGVNLHRHDIPFIPDLVQLDFQLQPVLWIECGDCSVTKLDKLAVKVPEAKLWLIKRSAAAVDDLIRAMTKAQLRRDRYQVLGMEAAVFDEVCSHMSGRNEITWVRGSFDPPEMQFDFNGLWFELPFIVRTF